jgi:hypothetical protein
VVTDVDVTDLRGTSRRLKEFRRRTHVLLIWDPGADDARRAAWRDLRAEQDRRWIWLAAEVAVATSAPGTLPPGMHLVSRWGGLVKSWPPGIWDLEAVEQELLTWEARDGCDLGAAP